MKAEPIATKDQVVVARVDQVAISVQVQHKVASIASQHNHTLVRLMLIEIQDLLVDLTVLLSDLTLLVRILLQVEEAAILQVEVVEGVQEARVVAVEAAAEVPEVPVEEDVKS